ARVDDLVVGLDLEGARDISEERRPAGAALVLHLGREDGQAAAGADEDPGALFIVQGTAARALGAFLAQHVVREALQALFPLVLRELQRLRGVRYFGAGSEQAFPV